MTRSIPDVVLERYRLQELPERSARAVERMMAADPDVRARLDALAASDAEISQEYPPSAFVRDVPAPSRRLVMQVAMAAALGVGALLLVVALPRSASSPVATERVKGSSRPSLALYRRTDNGSERLADGDVARPQRRREDRVVEPGVLQLEEHVEGRVEDGPVHRRGRQQRRGDEGCVGDDGTTVRGDRLHERAQADAE